MARPLYRIDSNDPCYPRIVMIPYRPGLIGFDDSEEGMPFGAAKESLLQTIRYHRDHWVTLFREAKRLVESDIKREIIRD